LYHYRIEIEKLISKHHYLLNALYVEREVLLRRTPDEPGWVETIVNSIPGGDGSVFGGGRLHRAEG